MYACTVMCDGSLFIEFRDAIHQGDGLQILQCWKFMLLYFKKTIITILCFGSFPVSGVP